MNAMTINKRGVEIEIASEMVTFRGDSGTHSVSRCGDSPEKFAERVVAHARGFFSENGVFQSKHSCFWMSLHLAVANAQAGGAR